MANYGRKHCAVVFQMEKYCLLGFGAYYDWSCRDCYFDIVGEAEDSGKILDPDPFVIDYCCCPAGAFLASAALQIIRDLIITLGSSD